MFYHALAAIPEWAPAGQNHILYSETVLKNVSVQNLNLQYEAVSRTGVEFLSLSFEPIKTTVNGINISLQKGANDQGYTKRKLSNGNYAVKIKRTNAGKVIISGS